MAGHMLGFGGYHLAREVLGFRPWTRVTELARFPNPGPIVHRTALQICAEICLGKASSLELTKPANRVD